METKNIQTENTGLNKMTVNDVANYMDELADDLHKTLITQTYFDQESNQIENLYPLAYYSWLR